MLAGDAGTSVTRVLELTRRHSEVPAPAPNAELTREQRVAPALAPPPAGRVPEPPRATAAGRQTPLSTAAGRRDGTRGLHLQRGQRGRGGARRGRGGAACPPLHTAIPRSTHGRQPGKFPLKPDGAGALPAHTANPVSATEHLGSAFIAPGSLQNTTKQKRQQIFNSVFCCKTHQNAKDDKALTLCFSHWNSGYPQ